MRAHLQVILLPTNKCNVNCEYCFEDKTNDRMSHDQLTAVFTKLLDFMDDDNTGSLKLHWQGGEIMTLPVEWFEKAHDIIETLAVKRGKRIENSLQTNLIGYHPRWNDIIRKMFGNSVGTSMDYPNLYRKLFKGGPDDYTRVWIKNIEAAREAGIGIGVIAVTNQRTLEIGAEAFYSYFVNKLGITDFQVNTPFPGGEGNNTKEDLALENQSLARFFNDLTDIWAERGYGKGINLSPVSQIVARFSNEPSSLPCIWQANCADEFFSVDARGFVAQCDCWVTSYPEYFYGNMFESGTLSELLAKSPAHKEFIERPAAIIDNDCIECDYLSMCHGGCPVRTYTYEKTLTEKDPFCSFYRSLFRHSEGVAAGLLRKTLPVSNRGPAATELGTERLIDRDSSTKIQNLVQIQRRPRSPASAAN